MASIDISGQTFGLLTVVSRSDNSKKGQARWLCDCSCGQQTIVLGTSLRSGNTKSCGHRSTGSDNGNWKGYGGLGGSYINSVRGNARKRGLEFSLSTEYAWKLLVSQDMKCALSGWPIVAPSSATSPNTASLDRVDSKVGYIEGNVQWLHKAVNLAKQAMTDVEFIGMCLAVAETQTETGRAETARQSLDLTSSSLGRRDRSLWRLRAGENHPSSLLTEDDVRRIRARYAEGGITYKMLSEDFGVSIGAIGRVVSRKTWQHVQQSF